MKRIRTQGRRRGVSIMELMISILIVSITMSIVLPAMVYLARVLKGIRTEHRMLQQVSLFTQRVTTEMTRSTRVTLIGETEANFRGFDSEYVVDAGSPTGQRYDQETVVTRLVYEDDDNNPATIRDNRIVMFTRRTSLDGTLISETQDVLLEWVSPALDEDGNPIPVFVEDTDQGRPYIEMTVRIGDRARPPADEDDALTGPFYQGFYLRYAIVPYTISV